MAKNWPVWTLDRLSSSCLRPGRSWRRAVLRVRRELTQARRDPPELGSTSGRRRPSKRRARRTVSAGRTVEQSPTRPSVWESTGRSARRRCPAWSGSPVGDPAGEGEPGRSRSDGRSPPRPGPPRGRAHRSAAWCSGSCGRATRIVRLLVLVFSGVLILTAIDARECRCRVFSGVPDSHSDRHRVVFPRICRSSENTR